MTQEPNPPSESADSCGRLNFIEQIIAADNASGKYAGRVHTRFPPEPNGYLHIGHAKSICLNFGLAEKHGGLCNLRFDDTNPTKESDEDVAAIQRDVHWLGFDWGDGLYFASSYFEQLYEWALQLIRDGRAYVCDLTADEIRQYRGTLTEPGRNSPYRQRSIAENLDLFQRMNQGEFPGGSRTLRASGEGKKFLDEAIRTLPESLRIFFLLRDVEGLYIKETADATEPDRDQRQDPSVACKNGFA